MSEIRTLDAAALPWRDLYRRLSEIVVPRPIALVSTVDAEGRENLAPFSYYTVLSSNPPIIAFAPQLSGRTGAEKDTLRNAEETGELVVGVVTEALAEQVNRASAALPHGESEFAHSGLTPLPARRVRPPLIAESPVNIECELVEVRRYGAEPGAGSLVVARVLLVHAADALFDESGAIRPERLRAVGRMGGSSWVRTGDLFQLQRP